MIYDLSFLKDFQENKHLILEDILKKYSVVADQDIEGFLHALVDISSALIKIYNNIIPTIIDNKNIEKEELEDLLCDMRTQFRHIKYHIKDHFLSSVISNERIIAWHNSFPEVNDEWRKVGNNNFLHFILTYHMACVLYIPYWYRKMRFSND